jgi:hypothetical protein
VVEVEAACAGTADVGVCVGSLLGIFSCSGGVGWLGVDSARIGTGTFQGAISAGLEESIEMSTYPEVLAHSNQGA